MPLDSEGTEGSCNVSTSLNMWNCRLISVVLYKVKIKYNILDCIIEVSAILYCWLAQTFILNVYEMTFIYCCVLCFPLDLSVYMDVVMVEMLKKKSNFLMLFSF